MSRPPGALAARGAFGAVPTVVVGVALGLGSADVVVGVGFALTLGAGEGVGVCFGVVVRFGATVCAVGAGLCAAGWRFACVGDA